MQMGSENYKELGVAAAKGVGAEGNEASETQHHTTEAFRGAVRSLGSVLQAKLHFGKITIPASGGGKGG